MCSILSELKSLVNQIGSSPCDPCGPCCNPAPCCDPPCFTNVTWPYAQVIISTPPPILAPTVPQPVKPLHIFCPKNDEPLMTLEERILSRYDNFYNNYNIDWRIESPCIRAKNPRLECTPAKKKGLTVDGKSPCCEECIKPRPGCEENPGCPTGFKPCTMKLTPPCCCHPCGVWTAEVQPCPPKCRKHEYLEIGAALKSKCKK